jgi:hypothetical protein
VPPQPFVPNVIKTKLSYTWGPRLAVNLLHFVYSGPPATPSDLHALNASVRAEWVARVLPHLASTLTLSEVHSIDLSSAIGAEAIDPYSDSGSGGTAILYIGACAVVEQHTPTHYRGGHSKFFLPGALDGATSSGRQWSSGYLSGFNADLALAFAVFVGVAEGAITIQAPAVVHYVKNKVHLAAPIVEEVQSWILSPNIGSQRRRLGTRA